MTTTEIVEAILAYQAKEGGPVASWYVGISDNAKERLFSGHGVEEKNAWWIHCEADTEPWARAAEKVLLGEGFVGGPGGGTGGDTVFVYAYRKGPNTSP